MFAPFCAPQMYLSEVSQISIRRSSFSHNSAILDGGCLWATATACAAISNSSFSGCSSASSSGGASWLGFVDQATPNRQSLGCSKVMLKAHLESASHLALGLIDDRITRQLSPSLVVAKVIVSSCSSVGAGGGMSLHVQSGLHALIDQMLVTGSTSGSGNGGGLAIDASLPVRLVCSCIKATVSLPNHNRFRGIEFLSMSGHTLLLTSPLRKHMSTL